MSPDTAVRARPEAPWIRRSFGAAAAGYDGYATLQRTVGGELLSQWSAGPAAPATILDVGAGTGYFARELHWLFPNGQVVALDIAEGMLRVARNRLLEADDICCLCGQAEALPLAVESVDLVFSNLAIQWCADPVAVFGEFRRVLRPGGTVLFSTFGAATLAELRRAWAAADGHSHVNRFTPVTELQAALAAAGFEDIAMAVSSRRLAYPDVRTLMRELKGLGAHNVTAGRPRHLTGKGALQRMLGAYPPADGGGIVATFETITGCARVAGR